MTKPPKNVRLEDMNKTALVKTVKTLRTRETKLLNRIAKLEEIKVSAQMHPMPSEELRALERVGGNHNPFPWEETS